MKQTEYAIIALPTRETRKRIRKVTKIAYKLIAILCAISLLIATYMIGILCLNVVFDFDQYVPENALIKGIIVGIIAVISYCISAWLDKILRETKGE